MVTKQRHWLIALRKDRTQQEVADSAGITRSSYAHIETGRRDPSVATAKRIASALNFEWTLFFKDHCDVTPPTSTGTEG